MGRIRALLTTIGTILIAYGVNDGQGWEPVIGAVMAVGSLGWGTWLHFGTKTSASLSWSLVRKTVNSVGSALVTYGIVEPDKVSSILMAVGALGPVLAIYYTGIANDEDGDDASTSSGSSFVLLGMLSLGCLALPSCADFQFSPTITSQGCIEEEFKTAEYGTYTIRGCLDGYAEIEWLGEELDSGDAVRIKMTIYGTGVFTIAYSSDGESWLEWSEKSGISFGDVPPEAVEVIELESSTK